MTPDASFYSSPTDWSYREADVTERVVLTDKLIKGLRPGDKRYDVIDALVPGLLACVNPGGTVTMMLRTRVGAKSPIRRAIGQSSHASAAATACSQPRSASSR